MCALGVLAPLAAQAKQEPAAFVPQSLLDAAAAQPDAVYKVVVQGEHGSKSGDVAGAVAAQTAAEPGRGKGLKRRFVSISGVSAELTGKQILKLAMKKGILAITPDAPLRLTEGTGAPAVISPPVVTGVAQAGSSLSASAGDWAGDAPLAFAYQWERCAAVGRAAAVAADAPLGFWRLGEQAGAVAADAGGGGLAGSYVGAVALGQAGVSGGGDSAAGLDGSSAYVEVPGIGDAALASGFTLEAWVKAGAQSDRGIVGKWSYPGGGALLWIDPAGHYGLAVTSDPANYVTTTVGPTGGWEHLAGSWNGNTLRLYLNGRQIGSRPFGGSLGNAAVPLQLGNYGDGIRHLQGSLDEAAVYSRPLSAEQIRTHYLGCRPIDGATDPSYTLTTADLDTSVRVRVTASNLTGSSSKASEVTGTVTAPAPAPPPLVAPTNTTRPGIDGSPVEGQTLTGTAGTWAADPAPTYAYRWQRCDAQSLACTDIADATGATYTVTGADLDTRLRVLVTASNPAGTSSEASDPTATVVAAPPPPPPAPTLPALVSPPALQGSAVEGETLTATGSTWTGDAPITYTYQWQRCDAAGLACTDVADATGTSYTLTWTDIASKLKVVVRASNAAGVASAASDTSAAVAEGTGYSSRQLWPYVARVASLWPAAPDAQAAPAIAIVDSGIDAARADFGGRVVKEVTLTTLLPNSPGDGRGHGTFVASIAAGEAHGHTGAAPNAKLVSLDVFDDSGMATISDVIAAADWIYQNKDTYGIRVANFSLTGTVASSVKYDPLDRAVEKLWLSGVVVVAAVGNYAVSGAESGVPYAPGNDPFVISVGADDSGNTLSVSDDVAAPWSAFGYTPDGFAKPELGAPGRYLVGAVPPGSTLALERPAQIVEPGYMQLSGTSFAAPIVAGAAAELLAAHPAWTPDQVKGALMLAALPVPAAVPRSLGVGVLDAAQATAVVDPPNPNLALRDFVVPDPAGGPTPVFDAAAWGQAAATNPAWASAAWGQAAWGQAAWGQAAWGQTYWSSAAWGQDTPGGVDAPTSNAESDVLASGGYWITPAQLANAPAGGR